MASKILLLSLLFVSALSAPPVRVAFYTESLCPYCAQFTQGTLKKVLETPGVASIIDLKFSPFGNGKKNADGSFTCQHGKAECDGNLWMACAIHHFNETQDHFPFIHCMEKHFYDQLNKVEECANEANIHYDRLRECFEDEELSYSLLNKHYEETKALDPPHKYVPWVTVEDKPLLDDRDRLLFYVCQAYQGEKPPACDSVLGVCLNE